ncbi:MAG TPA: cupin domain-containing protein [Janthinobacterium sp.]|nr:cupin domain-containing protein [Janthinobacterium sp.]
MRVLPATFALALAFAGGVIVSPLLQHALPDAHAETPGLTAEVYDLSGMQGADLPATSNPEMRSKPLVVTDNATVALQVGNAPEHYHAKTAEIQYIIEGTGQMWLGKERRDIKPGSLIVIPPGTPHAGTIVTSSMPIKAIAIKIPPQGSSDYVLVK